MKNKNWNNFYFFLFIVMLYVLVDVYEHLRSTFYTCYNVATPTDNNNRNYVITDNTFFMEAANRLDDGAD